MISTSARLRPRFVYAFILVVVASMVALTFGMTGASAHGTAHGSGNGYSNGHKWGAAHPKCAVKNNGTLKPQCGGEDPRDSSDDSDSDSSTGGSGSGSASSWEPVNGDWLLSYGRPLVTSVCTLEGFGPSWAMWPNNHTGGYVCDRTVPQFGN